MNYTVELTLTIEMPLTEEQLLDMAGADGGTAGALGGHNFATTLTVFTHDMPGTATIAIDRVTVIAPGSPASIEVMNADEQDRRLAEPAFPELVGISEVAEILGVSRQRASQLQGQQAFPAPVATLQATPVWRKSDLGRFFETWDRRPGRRANG